MLLSLAVPLSAIAQSAPAPDVKHGDTWTYTSTTEKGPSGWNQTHEQVTVLRATSTHIYFGSRPLGSTQAPRELIAAADRHASYAGRAGRHRDDPACAENRSCSGDGAHL